MSPKPTVSRQSILDAAWELVRAEGADKLNARNLAARLGTSTMPIYSAVGSMAELDALLRQRVGDTLNAWQKRSWGPNAMLDMAVGYVMFAREEPRLFLYLFSAAQAGEGKGSGKPPIAAENFAQPLDMPGAQDLLDATPGYGSFIAGMARDTQNSFVFRTWIFVHGLAILVADGLLDLPQADLISHLEAAGGAFYLYHSQTGGAQ